MRAISFSITGIACSLFLTTVTPSGVNSFICSSVSGAYSISLSANSKSNSVSSKYDHRQITGEGLFLISSTSDDGSSSPSSNSSYLGVNGIIRNNLNSILLF